ncbi:MAG: hypothetical protein ABI833_00435 [Acidobacteriota bacterium]
MLALVVPSATEADLFYQFLRVRDSWPQQAMELKGSKLKEDQVAQVIDLLAAHDVIAEFYGIDMARHPTDIIGHGSMSPSIILFRGRPSELGRFVWTMDRKDRDSHAPPIEL